MICTLFTDLICHAEIGRMKESCSIEDHIMGHPTVMGIVDCELEFTGLNFCI